MIKTIRRSSRDAGGCNFCNRHTTARGETTHMVTEVSGSDTTLYVRFCDPCLDELVTRRTTEHKSADGAERKDPHG